MPVNPANRGHGRNLGDRLAAAGRAFNDRLIEGIQAAGYPDVRAAHSAVMPNLDPNGTRIVDLAARAGITKQSMGELVEDLVRRGYVEVHPDPADRRAKIVALTDKGRRQSRAALRIISRMERRYRERLGDDRFEGLLATLDELARMEPDGGGPVASRLGQRRTG
jgi:DNA-binding MarR family transcriptional regulator